MRTIVVSGSGSGAGKTRLAEILLSLLPCFSAIKVTLNDTYTAVSDNERDIMIKGKDTHRLAVAGAQKVVWVRSTEEDLTETISLAASLLPPKTPGVLIEGSHVLSLLPPDLCFFVTDGDVENMKPSRITALKRAQVVVLNLRQGAFDSDLEPRIRSALTQLNPDARFIAADLMNPNRETFKDILAEFCLDQNSAL